MKRFVLFLLALCMTAFTSAQTPTPKSPVQETPTAQQTPPNSDKTAAQRDYDPLAGREHLRGGIWDNAMNSINPCNIDYGAQVDAWRRMIVDETIANVIFWTAIVVSIALFLAVLYIYWLHHDRARRLEISVNILTQIANAFIDARDHALDAIKRHNHLADDYNTMAEKMAALDQQKSDTQKRVRGGSSSESASEEISPEMLAAGSDEMSSPNPQLDPQLLPQLQQAAVAQAQQRFAHQISALNEKNKALRMSMNELITENDRLKQQCASLKGA